MFGNGILYRNIYFQPILTYGSETWAWTKKAMSRLQAAEMRFLRGMEKSQEETGYRTRRLEKFKGRLIGGRNEEEKLTMFRTHTWNGKNQIT